MRIKFPFRIELIDDTTVEVIESDYGALPFPRISFENHEEIERTWKVTEVQTERITEEAYEGVLEALVRMSMKVVR